MYRLSECIHIDLDIRRRDPSDPVAVETVTAECAMQERVHMECGWFAADRELCVFRQIG